VNILQDLWITLRTMRRNWRFSLFAILIMSCGLTTSVFLFSMVENTLLAPMPFEGGEQLRRLDLVKNGDVLHGENLTIHEYNAIKKSTSNQWKSLS